MLQSLILIDALSSTYWEKKKKIKRNGQGQRGWTHLAGCAAQDFHSCEMQLKADLSVSL
jgi:hypothetical protein